MLAHDTPLPVAPQVPVVTHIVLPDGKRVPRHMGARGYITFTLNGKSVREHAWIWEQSHGPTPKGYVIHHRNLCAWDNHVENLESIPKPEHIALHCKGMRYADRTLRSGHHLFAGEREAYRRALTDAQTAEKIAMSPPGAYFVFPDGRCVKRHLKKDGYYRIWVSGKEVPEHRYLYEQAHGSIPEGMDVHHRNKIKTDNRLENLVALPEGEHSALHARKWHEPCLFEGCDREPHCHGYCRAHYEKLFQRANQRTASKRYAERHRDEPGYKARTAAKSARWRDAHPDRAKEAEKRSNHKRYAENPEYFKERARAQRAKDKLSVS